MNKKTIGSLCASLMVAGAVAVTNPGVAMAEVGGYTGTQLVDPAGADRGMDSPFGSKLKVYVSVYTTDRVSCRLALTPEGSEAVAYQTSFSLRDNGNFASGVKVTPRLFTNKYAATVSCRNSKETLYTSEFAATIQNAPPLEFSGTATCYDPTKGAYVRPKGLDVQVYEMSYKVLLRNATAGEDRASTSIFSYRAYDTSVRPTLKCLGTTSKPGYTTTFDGYTLPATDVVLKAGGVESR